MLSTIKKDLKLLAVITLVITSIMLYRAYFVDPELDAVYAEIYGVEEVGR